MANKEGKSDEYLTSIYNDYIEYQKKEQEKTRLQWN